MAQLEASSPPKDAIREFSHGSRNHKDRPVIGSLHNAGGCIGCSVNKLITEYYGPAPMAF